MFWESTIRFGSRDSVAEGLLSQGYLKTLMSSPEVRTEHDQVLVCPVRHADQELDTRRMFYQPLLCGLEPRRLRAWYGDRRVEGLDRRQVAGELLDLHRGELSGA